MVDDLFKYLIVMYNEKTYIRASECVTHIRGIHSTVTYILWVKGVKVVTST